MIDLAELLAKAQEGSAVDTLARHYGLSAAQCQAVVAAFLPAFASAFKRKAAEPAAVRELVGLTMGEAYRHAFETAQAASTPQVREAGTAALATLFGSKEVSRAIADQMAAHSGVESSVLKSMLPVLTSMTLGGVGSALKASTPDRSPLATFTTAMGGSMPAPTELAGLLSSALAGVAPQMMTDVMRQAGLSSIETSGAALREAVGDAANPAGPNTALGDLLGAFVQGYNRGRPMPEPEASAEPERFDPAKLMGDLFSQALSAGRSAQGDHALAIERIFDRMLSPNR